jgi:hypothetical protein
MKKTIGYVLFFLCLGGLFTWSTIDDINRRNRLEEYKWRKFEQEQKEWNIKHLPACYDENGNPR